MKYIEKIVVQLLDIDNLRTFCRYVFQDGSLKSGLQLTIRLLLIYLEKTTFSKTTEGGEVAAV